MQYMWLREYMHHIGTEWPFKFSKHLADSVQYVIDDILRQNVPAYRCLWLLYVNFYREEKKQVLGLPNQKNGALRHDGSCCAFKISELTFVLVEIFVVYVCCMFDKPFLLPFWQKLMQFDCAVCKFFLFIFHDKKLVSPKNGETFGECQVVFFSVIWDLENWELATFAKLTVRIVVNFLSFSGLFCLNVESYRSANCNWFCDWKTLQHVITVKELTLKKICRRTWVWCVLDINENLCCNWNIQHKIIAIPSKMLNKKAEGIVSTLLEQKFLTEPLMITPS